MNEIFFKNQLVLSLEHLNKRVRIIIKKADVELACRKETVKNLERFLDFEYANIFKGRLQLKKSNDQVIVFLKSEPIGVIDVAQFTTMLKHF